MSKHLRSDWIVRLSHDRKGKSFRGFFLFLLTVEDEPHKQTDVF